MLAVSVYDTKSSFSTTASTSFKWVRKERLVYSKDIGGKYFYQVLATPKPMTITTRGWVMLMFHIFSTHTIYYIASRGTGSSGGPYFLVAFHVLLVNFYVFLQNLHGE